MKQAGPVQTTLDDGFALREATFCIVDLETTGGSPVDSAITEIGAVKYREGERIGVFHTLVDPRRPIPIFISRLTGIDDLAVAGMPPIDGVVPDLVEFLRGCVFVAHNARFDLSFVNAALSELDYELVPGPPVCTAKLARRIVWPEVPNVKLRTLAQYFRTSVAPSHRALDDAQACAEVFHGLLDLGGRLGIATLGDLHEACRARGRPNFGKIRLADHLPDAAGVYLFRGRDGGVLYVGKSTDLRSRVKSYFYGDPRKKISDLLDQTARVDGLRCATELEALVLEARLIREHEPRFNRRGKAWRRYSYLKLDLAETYPRLKIVREAKGPGAFLGPFRTSRAAGLVKDALEDVFPIRRCTRSMRASTRFPPCALADIGRCLAPCDGRVDPESYEGSVRDLVSSLSNPDGLLEALERRMAQLAAEERYEEAALARDRLRALADELTRMRADSWLLGSGTLVLRDRAGNHVRLERASVTVDVRDVPPSGPLSIPVSRERADELAAVRRWMAAARPVVERADTPPTEPVPGGRRLHAVLERLRAARSEPARDPGDRPHVPGR